MGPYKRDKGMKEIRIPAPYLKKTAREMLLKAAVRADVAEYVAEGLVSTSLRGVDSHGIRLLPHYLEGVRRGRINPDPVFRFNKTSPSTGMLDADHTFGHAAGIVAAEKAVRLAEKAGSGHVAVYNSTHFGAAAYYSIEIAKHDMIGVSFTHADALVRSHGGVRPFLGTNPLSFAAPCDGEGPFCLDMATSAITFNRIRQLRESGLKAPDGTGADITGSETIEPNEIEMLLPVGAHKGYGLGMMVEILCSMLTGMPYGPHITNMFKASMSEKRFLAHFVMAIRIDCFQDKDIFKKRLARMIRELRNEPRASDKEPVMVAGDPEKRAAKERLSSGIPLALTEYEALKVSARYYGVKIEPPYGTAMRGKKTGRYKKR